MGDQHVTSGDAEFGVSDIREKHICQVKNNIHHIVSKEIRTCIDSIHVMGSLAEGTGTRGESDIDIRVVTTGLVRNEVIEELQTKFRHDYDNFTPPDCTYIDLYITPLHPDETESSEKI
mgnify:CR=1 FL=1